MRPLLLATAALLILGCENKARTFLGPTAVSILEQPTKIEAWRIHAKPGGPEKSDPPKPVDLAIARDLAPVLLAESTYSFNSAKGCKFTPGMGVRVWRDAKAVDVIFCFSCNELKLVSPDPVAKGYYRTEDFDNARQKLVAIAKRALPDDAEIQALK